MDRISQYRHAAAWYAWGRQDAERRARVDVFEFANQVERAVRAYDTGQTSSLSSIQDMYADYLKGLAA